MWRSIAAKPCVTRKLGRKLISLQNPPPLVLFKPPTSSSWVSLFKFPHQNHRFLCHSCITEVESETHDTSSFTPKELKLNIDVDGIHVNSEAQMGSIGHRVDINFSKFHHLLNLLNNNNNGDETLESTLDSMDLCLNDEFLLELLHYGFSSKNHLSRFFKWVSSKKDLKSFTASILGQENLRFTSSVYAYEPGTINGYELLRRVNKMGEKENGLINAEFLFNFLSVFHHLSNEKDAFEFDCKFEEFGCYPDGKTYYYTIKRLCEKHVYDHSISICRIVLDNGMFPGSAGEVSQVISLRDKDRVFKVACNVYLAGKKIDDCSSMPSAFSLSEALYYLTKVDETVHFAHQMFLLGDISAAYDEDLHDPLLWVIRGLCRIKDIKSAKKLLCEMIEKGHSPPGNEVFHSVIEGLSKAGDLEDAREILELVNTQGLTPKISSYGVLMSGYAKAGLMEEACEVLLAAKNKLTKLCPIGLYDLIQGYCKLGEFEKALRLFFELKNYGVVPNVFQYNKLIQSLSLCLKDLDLETAQKLLEEMRMKGLYLPRIAEDLRRKENERLVSGVATYVRA